MDKLLFALLLLGTILSSCAPKDEGYVIKNNTVTVYEGLDTFVVSAIENEVIKISRPSHSGFIGPANTLSAANGPKLKVKYRENILCISTPGVAVIVTKNPLEFSFIHGGEKKVQSLGFSTKHDTSFVRYKLTPQEEIYGTGARALPLNRRGYRFQCYNQANYGYGMGADFLNYSIPHIMSSKRYMLFFDNPSKAWFDIGRSDTSSFEFSSLAETRTILFFGGDSYNRLVDKFTAYTGRQPLLPVWALGNLQSRFGYKSQAETEAVVNGLLKAGFPLDAIIIDLYWFGQQMQDGVMGNLSWDYENWPEPEKMIDNFSQKGVKTILISEPYFTRKSKHFDYLNRNLLFGLDDKGNTLTMPNFYFGEAGLIDIFKPEAADWLWQQYNGLKQQGVAGWWCDLGEPEIHPDTMVHINGKARDIHGLYGHEWTRLFYENYHKHYPNERLFVLGRAGYAGSQKYGLIPWSGDVGRTWSGLQAQIPVMLGMGMSGLAYMHSDAGGFAGYERNPELYTRWMQFAAFTPVFRPHSDDNAEPEPIFYADSVQQSIKKYIKLRYALLPYNYTLMWENHTTGRPLARALFMEYNNPEFAGNDSTFLWGSQMLVAPVLRPMARKQSVYLPKGVWFDLQTKKRFLGDAIVNADAAISDVPVFVKAGSFIPMVEPVSSTDDYTNRQLIVHFFHDSTLTASSYTMYADDGKTNNAYEQNLFETLSFSYSNGTVSISNSGHSYEGRPKQRNITLMVHNSNYNGATGNGDFYPLEKFGNAKGLRFILEEDKQIDLIFQ